MNITILSTHAKRLRVSEPQLFHKFVTALRQLHSKGEHPDIDAKHEALGTVQKPLHHYLGQYMPPSGELYRFHVLVTRQSCKVWTFRQLRSLD